MRDCPQEKYFLCILSVCLYVAHQREAALLMPCALPRCTETQGSGQQPPGLGLTGMHCQWFRKWLGEPWVLQPLLLCVCLSFTVPCLVSPVKTVSKSILLWGFHVSNMVVNSPRTYQCFFTLEQSSFTCYNNFHYLSMIRHAHPSIVSYHHPMPCFISSWTCICTF